MERGTEVSEKQFWAGQAISGIAVRLRSLIPLRT
jgi:hypothetical protein